MVNLPEMPTRRQERRFGHLLYSELDAIQHDPSRPPDDRLDAWQEEVDRMAVDQIRGAADTGDPAVAPAPAGQSPDTSAAQEIT
jgi:hypothetical protein